MPTSSPTVLNPTKTERLTLWLLVFSGLCFMAVFVYYLFDKHIIANQFLYWLLIISLSFSFLKILHEWYHYLFITVPVTPPRQKIYTVDILTTFCAGEPYEMITETLTAIKNITYPHTTYLCDEANDPYLKEFCRQNDIVHVTRIKKINAKAGNINNALQGATGELCLILDPDHTPNPDFLEPIVDHFNDPQVGFVQVVQAYKNDNESLIAKGAAQQTYQFYGPMMMTMQKYGTVQAIGANCTFRRAALDTIGGHAPGLAEDMNTAMQLHAKGWKSVYVPQILALGLVPSTVSAYIKQQLKWSRGVFELLVTTYVKEFRKFTLLQKIHYGTIPLYYLSGIIYLINFLIPVISLLTGEVPVKIGLQSFFFIGLPFLISIVVVRHYVQKWVTKEEERGFHIVGGLMSIGTWWIFILGFVYTIIRKKIPYLPTPKDGSENNNWPLLLPNIIVLLITLFSMVYGLYNDWNPYIWFMAGLAAINCMILIFNIAAARQLPYRKFKQRHTFAEKAGKKISKTKGHFWLLRRRLYKGVRSYPVLILSLCVCIGFFMAYRQNQNYLSIPQKLKKEEFVLRGIFNPIVDDGFSIVSNAQKMLPQKQSNIISLYTSWNSPFEEELFKKIDSIHLINAIPLVTWEPWQTYLLHKNDSDRHVFKNILKGNYDAYILQFAQRIKATNAPVFLRFAHEFDNPFYPWSQKGGNTADDFKSAWIHVHNLFDSVGTKNTVWVWNPWNPETIEAYFPGKEYIDWIGLDILNYANVNPDKKDYSFSQLYESYKQSPLLRAGVPVMIAEMGCIGTDAAKKQWLQNAFNDIQNKYNEIKSFVLFNSAVDKNSPNPNVSVLNWQVNDVDMVLNKIYLPHFYLPQLRLYNAPVRARETEIDKQYQNIKGINYQRAQNWINNYDAVFKKDIVADFNEMQQAGIQTIKFTDPDVYAHNMFTALKNTQLNAVLSFNISYDFNFLKDSVASAKLSKKILHTVSLLKSNKKIIGWNFDNLFYQARNFKYDKPELFYQKQAYFNWLENICKQIKQIDPERKISIDILADEDVVSKTDEIYDNVPHCDYIGLVIDDKNNRLDLLPKITVPWFISSIEAHLYIAHSRLLTGKGTIIKNWRDREQWHSFSFDGLKNANNDRRIEYVQLWNLWSSQKLLVTLPPTVKILKPAVTNFAGLPLTYRALVFKNNYWQIEKENTAIKYTWYLVGADAYGNPVNVKEIGEGPAITFTCPNNPAMYQIYLVANVNNIISSYKTSLNIPLN